MRRKQGARHLLQCKNSKRKRRLGQATELSAADYRNVRENLPFSH